LKKGTALQLKIFLYSSFPRFSPSAIFSVTSIVSLLLLVAMSLRREKRNEAHFKRRLRAVSEKNECY